MKTDPTKTTTLRRRMVQNIRRIFKALQKEIALKIDKLPQRLTHSTPSEAVEEFGLWLEHRVNLHAFSTYQVNLWGKYGLDGLRKGAESSYRSKNAVRHRRSDRSGRNGILSMDGESIQIFMPPDTSQSTLGFALGAKQEFLRSLIGRQDVGDALKGLQSQMMNEIKSVYNDLIGKCKRELFNGVLRKLSMTQLKFLCASVLRVSINRLITTAHTELTRCYVEGQLLVMESLGVETTKLKAEWMSNEMACKPCSDLHGKQFTVKKARGIIPLHPNCKCCWT